MTKINVKTSLLPHSQAKVEFLKSYLGRYLRILNRVNYIQKINLFDVFCGMGIYDGGGKGSPIVIAESICEIAKTEPNLLQKISLYLNDVDKIKIENVKKHIKQKDLNLFDIHYYNLDIQAMFAVVLNKSNQNIKTTFNLAFIDPYGYKEIKKDILTGLLQNQHTEIILFLPISHMYRFTKVAQTDMEKMQYKPLRDFIESFFTENHPIRTQQVKNPHDYINYLKEAFSFKNNRFSASYFIERNESNFNALFFMTSHIYGLEKILEVKWQLNDENGKGFTQPKSPTLFDDYFADEAKENNIEKLKQIILNELSYKKMTNVEMYRLVLQHEFLPKHANEILKGLQNSNRIQVVDVSTGVPARKGSFYLAYNIHRNATSKVIIKIST